jgi:hypothetical protein
MNDELAVLGMNALWREHRRVWVVLMTVITALVIALLLTGIFASGSSRCPGGTHELSAPARSARAGTGSSFYCVPDASR